MAGYPPEKACRVKSDHHPRPILMVQQQSPIERYSHEGLELDTRAGDGSDKHLDHSKPLPDLKKWQEEEENSRYLNEKQMIQAHEVPQSSPTSAESSMGMMSPQTPQRKMMDDPMGSPPEPRTRRICGLRRGIFWLLFALVLALVIVAAVVGGVVGGTRHSQSNNGVDQGASSATPAAGNVPAQPGDVVAGSPLNVISYIGNGTSTGSKADRQVFRVYYQSVLGNIKEAVSTGPNKWAAATPIFTDAMNNTGLATVTYMNGSAPTGQMFYVGTNGYMQEKRKSFNDLLYWEPGTFNPINVAAIGNISLPKSGRSTNDPNNNWDSYRMAAVYSDLFSTGPGTRFFCHQASSNGTNWVQEYIWTQQTDEWRTGQAIMNVFPNSQIAATLDEKNSLLRLYFSSGNLTLQEVWLNVSDPNSIYNNGFSVPNFLPQNDVELTVISINGTVYLYHPSNIGQLGIRELIISGVPGSILANSPQESYNLSEALVAQPQIASIEGTSPYQPLAVGITRIEDAPFVPHIWLWWADHVTGSQPAKEGSVTGYNTLQAVMRQVVNGTWSTQTPVVVPLGTTNSFPKASEAPVAGDQIF
ncbi:MAG: hypothetical protein Q9218_003152 [Villophora microphyllina]